MTSEVAAQARHLGSVVALFVLTCGSSHGFFLPVPAGVLPVRITSSAAKPTPHARSHCSRRRRSATNPPATLACYRCQNFTGRRRREEASTASPFRRTFDRVRGARTSGDLSLLATAAAEGDNDRRARGEKVENDVLSADARAGLAQGAGENAVVAELKQSTVNEGGPPKWAPRWAVNSNPLLQAGASVALYFFHMLCLSKSGLTFPVQLIPNDNGLCQSVGLDTAAGFAVLAVAGWSRLRSGLPLFPPVNDQAMPWKLNKARLKKKLPSTFVVLVVAYLLSGLGAQVCEYLLYWLGRGGITMSVAMHRSVQVLMSHLVWVFMGVRIIGLVMKPFFNRKEGSWVDMKWKSNWLWWVVGGYFVSSALFNMADLANQFVCPLPPDTESVVVKIINPENNDVAAMAMGSIAPCVSAPWWEEVLYRGFLLPALTVYLPLKAAVPSSAVLFAVHHMNLQAMLPLSVLGLVWSLLYLYSGNLLVTVLVHSMWNSRVFLGSLLGL